MERLYLNQSLDKFGNGWMMPDDETCRLTLGQLTHSKEAVIIQTG
jgi:hypothetical protein